MVANVLHKHPTPRALAEAMDAHARACTLRNLPGGHAKWLLAEDLVPGKKRRKLSETVAGLQRAVQPAQKQVLPPAPCPCPTCGLSGASYPCGLLGAHLWVGGP